MQIKVEDLSYVYSPKTPFEKVALDATLCQHFNALIRVTHGKIYVGDVDISSKKTNLIALRKQVGMLFQFPEYQLFDDTVAKDVQFGPLNFGFGKEEAARMAEEAISRLSSFRAERKDAPR